MSGDFSPEQKRYLEGFTSGLQIARAGRGLGRQVRGAGSARPRCRASARAGPYDRRRRQAQRAGEDQARAAPVRRLFAPQGAGGQERVPEARRQLPLAILRAVLCRAGAEFLHVPPAHAERHPQALAVVGPGRSRRSASAAAIRTSRRAPICRSARSRRRTRSRCSKRSRTSACARAARAPTTSATSPARRPPASTRRS